MSDNERTILDFPPSSPGITPSRLPFFVVGIGASAGGIEALLRFFAQMPADNGMAFVVVLHLSPDHESSIAQILQTKTAMPVSQVTETVAIEKNHVYVNALLAQLRSKKTTATTLAIALSGFTRPTDVERALAAGFETHIRKPVVFDDFIETASRLS